MVEDIKKRKLEIANCFNCIEQRDLRDDKKALCFEHSWINETISEDELTDMFGEGGKEEIKEYYEKH